MNQAADDKLEIINSAYEKGLIDTPTKREAVMVALELSNTAATNRVASVHLEPCTFR